MARSSQLSRPYAWRTNRFCWSALMLREFPKKAAPDSTDKILINALARTSTFGIQDRAIPICVHLQGSMSVTAQVLIGEDSCPTCHCFRPLGGAPRYKARYAQNQSFLLHSPAVSHNQACRFFKLQKLDEP